VPLFTLRESAAYLHTPFVGFAQAFVLGALRRVPMQRIRPAVAKLSAEIGLDHALASQQVCTTAPS